MQKSLLIFLSIILVCSASSNYIIKPADSASGPQAALIFVQGAQIPNTAYETLMRQIQAESGFRLFIGFPGFKTLDTPNPLEIKGSVADTLKQLYAAGLDQNAPIFYSGHSLGSIMTQEYLVGNKVNAAGVILTGGYIQRKYLWPAISFNYPTLTIGGELDGLSRITRIAESYYIHIKRDQRSDEYPVVIVPGGNHYQFAGTGEIPFLVKERDLKAESSQQDSWNYISSAYVDFIKQRMGLSDGSDLKQKMAQTEQLITPIINAFELEGSKNFNAPNQIGGPLESTCVKGGCKDSSNWAAHVQEIIGANIDGWTVKASNLYAELSSTPITGKEFHLPKITSLPDQKQITVTTYAQNSWELLDNEDTGFFSTSAFDIAIKLASRQCIIINGTQVDKKTVPFSVDDPSFCRQANEEAYQLALKSINQNTVQRYQQYGVKYEFADDFAEEGGPLFLYSHVQYKNKTDQDGNRVVEISSPEQKTDVDYWEEHFHIPRPSFIPDPGCYHYCKVLSPARAVEWIFVDSLRDKYSIKQSQNTEAKFLSA